MPDCEYCGASFDDEEDLVAHLGDEHYEELGRIDRRRVDEQRGDAGGDLTVYLALGGGLALFAAIVYFLFLAGGGSGPSGVTGVPVTPHGETHEHGTINVTIRGVQVDFGQPQYQVGQTRNPHFHFEGGDGRVWHTHSRDVTIQYALATLDIGVTENSVTFEGVTYNASDPGTSIVVEVNGEPVDPTTYVLDGASSRDNAEQGDHVRIVVRVDESAG